MSALMPLFLSNMSLTDCGFTSRDWARRYPVIFIGLRNSRRKISPGWIAQAAPVRLSNAIYIPLPDLVVIGYFHVVSVAVFPGETHPVLSVYPNCMLTGPVFFEGMKSVSRRNLEIVKPRCCIDHLQLPLGHRAQVGGNCSACAFFPKCPSSFVGERLNQAMASHISATV
jgi:hypothetical protein